MDHQQTPPDSALRSGGPAARDALVLAHAPLAEGVALRVWRGLPRSVDLADLVADGFLGLLEAAERYEPDRGVTFPAYAAPRIRGSIIDGLRAADWVPRSVRRKMRDLEAATTDAHRRLGRLPPEAEVAAELGITDVRLRTMRAQTSYAQLVSLDAVLPDRVPGTGTDESDADRSGGVHDAVQQLPDREQWVISLSYWGRLTLTEIGQVLGISESRVCQLRSHATATLRISLTDAS